MPIRDLGYKPYEGARLPHRSRFKVLIRHGIAMGWRPGLMKTTIILSILPAVVCAVVMVLKIKTMQFVMGQLPEGALSKEAAGMSDPGTLVFTCIYWCQIWFALVVSLLTGASAISDDVGSGAFQLYFSRPVGRLHYIVGKVAPTAFWVAIVSAVPAILLAVVRLALSSSGAEAFSAMRWPLATLAYTPFYVAAFSLPAVAISTLGRNSAAVQGLWAGGIVVTWLLGEGVATAAELPYLALISLPTDLKLLGQFLYGMEPTFRLPWILPLLALSGYLALSALLLQRRLSRVEIFS